MGTVFRARDVFLDRDVAVKVVRTAAATDAEQQQTDAEAKILARLNHHSWSRCWMRGPTAATPEFSRCIW